MLNKVKTLEGYKLHGLDGEIGRVKDFYFEDQRWTIRYLVADTGNWLPGRQVLISPQALAEVVRDTQRVVVNLTMTQIEDSPALETDKPVSLQFEEAYYGYYGWPLFFGGPGAYPDPRDLKKWKDASVQERSSWNTHLRSSCDMRGHRIQATDGEIGHVDDLIIDDETWAIRYLIVDTKNWWPGKKVLLAPQWIDRISWDELKVFVNLHREVVKRSPEYTDELLLSRKYESALHHHYRREGYWADGRGVQSK